MQHRAKSVSDRLITRHGSEVTFSREGGAVENPFDPPPAGQEWQVQFLETGLNLDWVDGTTVQRGDVMGAIIAGDYTPFPGDTLTLRGQDYTVLQAKPIQPNADAPVVHYEIQARA